MLIFEAVVYETPPQQAEILLDESLFPRIVSGDKTAFLALYEKCSSPVFAYALSILRSRSDSEDAMQDTFLKIRSAAHLYKPLGKPLAWIFTITRNICLMMYRQRAHTAQLPAEGAGSGLRPDPKCRGQDDAGEGIYRSSGGQLQDHHAPRAERHEAQRDRRIDEYAFINRTIEVQARY